MTLREYVLVLRRQWSLIVVTTLVGLIAAASASILRLPDYTATTTLVVVAQPGESSTTAYQAAQLAQDRVVSYVELVNTPKVRDSVIAQLRLGESSDSLARRITVTSALNSVLVDIYVRDKSPEQAAAIANAVGSAFADLIDEVERPAEAGAPQAVSVRVVQPAILPTKSSSTGLPVLLAIGVVGGFLLGGALVLGKYVVNAAIRSAEELYVIAEAPSLGTVSAEPESSIAAIREGPRGTAGRGYREVAARLNLIGDSYRVVLVSSPSSGDGKTVTALNLALAQASLGKAVLLIDCDLRTGSLGQLLDGVDPTMGLSNVLLGQVDLRGAIQHWTNGGLDVLTSGSLPAKPADLLSSDLMRTVFGDVRNSYNLVIVDAPAQRSCTDSTVIAPLTDGAILVCSYGKTTRRALRTAVDALRISGTPIIGTLLTMVPSRGLTQQGTHPSANAMSGITADARRTVEPTWAPDRHASRSRTHRRSSGS